MRVSTFLGGGGVNWASSGKNMVDCAISRGWHLCHCGIKKQTLNRIYLVLWKNRIRFFDLRVKSDSLGE